MEWFQGVDSKRVRTVVLLTCLAWTGFGGRPSAALAASERSLEQFVESLPPDWRSIVVKYQDVLPDPDWYLKRTPDDAKRRGEVLQSLSHVPGAESFVLEHAFDGSVSRGRVLSLLSEMRTGTHWLGYGPLTAALEQAAVASPDPSISLAALDAVHVIIAQRVRLAISERKKAISWMEGTQYREIAATLDKADERARLYDRRDQLAGVRAYAAAGFSGQDRRSGCPRAGDGRLRHRRPAATGNGSHYAGAAPPTAVRFRHYVGRQLPVLHLRNEESGRSALEERFRRRIRPARHYLYPVFGNHDWACDMPISELLYSARNPHWRFPSPYYTYVAGPVQFFAINTQYGDVHPTASELAWLKAELDKSTARWKVVYSHFPIFSSDYTDDKLVSRLLPVLRGRADVYINGHIHNLREHKPVDGVHFFNISASGGAGGVPINTASQGTAWGMTTFGFGVLEADERTFTVHFIGADGKELHRVTLKK